MKVKTEYISLIVDKTLMYVYTAKPRDRESKGTIILYQEAFGVTGHMQTLCHRLAHEGYRVYAPELYHRHGSHITLEYHERIKVDEFLGNLYKEHILEDSKALLNYLETTEGVKPESIISIGFSIGGYASILIGSSVKLLGSVAYYPAVIFNPRDHIALKPIADTLESGVSPLLLFYGDRDGSIPVEEVIWIREKLNKAKRPYSLKVMDNCNHGFLCNQRSAYNKEAATQAWRETLDWINQRYIELKNRG